MAQSNDSPEQIPLVIFNRVSMLDLFRPFENDHNRGFPIWYNSSDLQHTMDRCDVDEPHAKVEWTWAADENEDYVKLSNETRDVTFNRYVSNGTAIVKGNQPMTSGHHFWEIKMISRVYGTDMMIGVGTDGADTSQIQNNYLSFLGKNDKTWGLSYTGNFCHDGQSQKYCEQLRQGDVIGINLDLWHKTLTFYNGKKPLGVASRRLRGDAFYPMACSTAACSGMRLLRAHSFPSSLQYLCCVRLRRLVPSHRHVLDVISVPPGLRRRLDASLGWLLEGEQPSRPPRIPDEDFGALAAADAEPSLSFFQVLRNNNGGRALSNALLGTNPRRYIPHNRGNPIRTVLRGGSGSGQNGATRGVSPDESESDSDCQDSDSVASKPKRKRFSYNYVFGLSDTDSD